MFLSNALHLSLLFFHSGVATFPRNLTAIAMTNPIFYLLAVVEYRSPSMSLANFYQTPPPLVSMGVSPVPLVTTGSSRSRMSGSYNYSRGAFAFLRVMFPAPPLHACLFCFLEIWVRSQRQLSHLITPLLFWRLQTNNWGLVFNQGGFGSPLAVATR